MDDLQTLQRHPGRRRFAAMAVLTALTVSMGTALGTASAAATPHPQCGPRPVLATFDLASDAPGAGEARISGPVTIAVTSATVVDGANRVHGIDWVSAEPVHYVAFSTAYPAGGMSPPQATYPSDPHAASYQWHDGTWFTGALAFCGPFPVPDDPHDEPEAPPVPEAPETPTPVFVGPSCAAAPEVAWHHIGDDGLGVGATHTNGAVTYTVTDATLRSDKDDHTDHLVHAVTWTSDEPVAFVQASTVAFSDDDAVTYGLVTVPAGGAVAGSLAAPDGMALVEAHFCGGDVPDTDPELPGGSDDEPYEPTVVDLSCDDRTVLASADLLLDAGGVGSTWTDGPVAVEVLESLTAGGVEHVRALSWTSSAVVDLVRYAVLFDGDEYVHTETPADPFAGGHGYPDSRDVLLRVLWCGSDLDEVPADPEHPDTPATPDPEELPDVPAQQPDDAVEVAAVSSTGPDPVQVLSAGAEQEIVVDALASTGVDARTLALLGVALVAVGVTLTRRRAGI